jgi:hypothetical protein
MARGGELSLETMLAEIPAEEAELRKDVASLAHDAERWQHFAANATAATN